MAQVEVMSVMRDVAQIVRAAPNGTLIAAYIRAARKFCRESRWYISTLSAQTVADVRLYSLGSDPDLEVVGLEAASCARLSGNQNPWALRVSGSGGWVPQTPTNTSHPTRYAYVPEGQVAFDPSPDDAYAIVLTLVLQPRVGVVSVPEELLVKWDQVLQAGALGYLLSIPGQPWTDLGEAKRQLAVLQSGINNAKADQQRSYNAGTVIAVKRPFIVGGRWF